MDTRTTRHMARLIRGLSVASVWLGFLLGLQWSLFIAFAFGGFVGLGVGLYYWQPQSRPAALPGSAPLSLPDGSSRRSETVARDLLLQIQTSSQRISSSEFRNGVARICLVAETIVYAIEGESAASLASMRFVDYYLPAMLRIATLYGELSMRPQRTPAEQAVLDRAEQILPEIEACFRRQLSDLQSDRFIALDTELAVLEMAMKSDDR